MVEQPKLTVLGKDIQPDQLRYKQKRVLVSKEFTFDASHHLHQYEGKCKYLHGHTYRIIYGVSSFLDDTGMALDFNEIKALHKIIVDKQLDHQYLNRALPPMNTTAENMAVWIYEEVEKYLEKQGLKDSQSARVEFIRLYETPTSYAEVRREWMEE